MSEYGLIKDTTMTAIADGLRDKGFVPKYANALVDCYKYKSDNATSLDDPTPILGVTDYCEVNVSIPEAVSLEFVFHISYYKGDNKRNESAGSIYLKTESSQFYNFGVSESTTITTRVDPRYGNTVTFGQSGSSYEGYCFGVTFEVYGLDADGNRMQLQSIGNNLNRLTPSEMVEAISNAYPPPPESAFNITGNCQGKFSYDGWNWFLGNYGEKLTTHDITNASNMFQYNPLDYIPMEINLSDNCSSTDQMFQYCNNLVELPVVNNFLAGASLCDSCKNLVSTNGNKYKTPNSTSVAANGTFNYCYKLRDVEGFFDNIPDEFEGKSIFGLHNTFSYCHSLDEVLGLPYVYSTYNASYFLSSMVLQCYRLKRLTFRNQVVTKSTKSATLELNTVGHATNPYGSSEAKTMYNYTDFTNETLVTDDASYQALKDNPDWWTDKVAYSRYNHDSAVETINSLPDITATGVTNIIKFNGAAGEKTDGGAINTLTEEEIAVATAKGWTVTLV